MPKRKIFVSEELGARLESMKRTLNFDSDEEMMDVVLAVMENFHATSQKTRNAKTRGDLLWLTHETSEKLKKLAKSCNEPSVAHMMDRVINTFQTWIDEAAKEGIMFGQSNSKDFPS